MKAAVYPGKVSGKVMAPASKSAMQRYLAAGLLAEGVTHIRNATFCDDTLAAVSIAGALGADITIEGSLIKIKGGFNPVSSVISCGESGLSSRMFTPVAALHNKPVTINGKGSLMKRPFDMVEKPLKALGVRVISQKGYLPLVVEGPLKNGVVNADGSLSSQFITGLLLALPVTGGDSIVNVSNLVSKPYVDLTISVLRQFGVSVNNVNYKRFVIPGGQKYHPCELDAEGDWSGGAFLLVMAAIAGKAEVSGLRVNSAQADKAILKALESAGAEVKVGPDSVTVKASSLKPFEFDLSDCPDLAPPLAVLALACKGRSVLKGAVRLVAKESNRGVTLESALGTVGGDVRFKGEVLEIEGKGKISGGTSGAFNDHRIAMALAVAGLISDEQILIEGFECINKSYPGFADDFGKLGCRIETD